MEKYTYKDSGVEWYGKVPTIWKRDKLFRICHKMGSGGTPTSTNESYYGGDIAWIQSGDLTDSYVSETEKKITEEALANSSAKMFPKGTLLVAMYGATIGKLGIMEMDAATNQACCALQLSKKIESKYMYYLMLDIRDFLITQAYGGGQPNISQEVLKQRYLYYPSLPEQKAIAIYLDLACERIDRIIAIKEEQLKKIEDYLSRKIDEIIVNGLSYFEKKYSRKDFIGNIPKHYKIAKLKHLCSQIVDGTHFTPNYIDSPEKNDIPFLRITDLHDESINLNEVKYIDIQEHKELVKRCKPEKGDVLLSKNGTVGITKIVDWGYEFSIFVSICLIKPLDLLKSEYLHYFFKSDIMKYQIHQGSKQITVNNLHLEKIREFYIVLPPKNEQIQLVDKIKIFEDKVKLAKINVINQIETLKAYRKSLIHECVTGKKQVV
jgi:type I restriction enzyme S subunit